LVLGRRLNQLACPKQSKDSQSTAGLKTARVMQVEQIILWGRGPSVYNRVHVACSLEDLSHCPGHTERRYWTGALQSCKGL